MTGWRPSEPISFAPGMGTNGLDPAGSDEAPGCHDIVGKSVGEKPRSLLRISRPITRHVEECRWGGPPHCGDQQVARHLGPVCQFHTAHLIAARCPVDPSAVSSVHEGDVDTAPLAVCVSRAAADVGLGIQRDRQGLEPAGLETAPRLRVGTAWQHRVLQLDRVPIDPVKAPHLVRVAQVVQDQAAGAGAHQHERLRRLTDRR